MSYDTWKQHTPEDDASTEVHRRLKHYLQETYDFSRSETKRALQDIITQLYAKKEVDLAVLDSRLAWLAEEYKLDIPDHQPTVTSIYQ